jgi:chaperonin GroES
MITALNDFVLLSYDRKKDEKGGIILSDVSKDKPAILKVESVGNKVENIKAGDWVLIDPFTPREVTIEGKKLYVLKEREIFGIIKK